MTMRVLWTLILLASTVAAEAAPLPRVGIAPVRVEVADDDRSPLDGDDLAAAVARGLTTGAVEVVPVVEVRAIATRAARAGLACDAATPACAARLAAFSDLDFIVVTRATMADDGPIAELALIDGHDGRTLRTRRAPLDDVAAGTAAVARALLDDAPVPGRLEVQGPAGVAVVVDGAVVGEAPLALEVGAGSHVVGGREVRVPAAGVVVMVVPTAAASGDDVTTALAITAGVGLGVALVAGIGAFVVAPEAARRDTYTARAWNDAVATGQGLVAVTAVGAAVAVVGGGLWAVSTWIDADDREAR